MDIGRADGDGPGKQDSWDDGAGCQVVGAETFDAIDVDSQWLWYSQVKITADPVNLFTNAWGEVPILVKVTIKDSTEGRSLDLLQTTAEGAPTWLRGVMGIEVVRPT